MHPRRRRRSGFAAGDTRGREYRVRGRDDDGGVEGLQPLYMAASSLLLYLIISNNQFYNVTISML